MAAILKFRDQEYTANRFDQKFRGTHFYGAIGNKIEDVFQVRSVHMNKGDGWSINLLGSCGPYEVRYDQVEIISTQIRRGWHTVWSPDWKIVIATLVAGTPPARQHTQGFNAQRILIEGSWDFGSSHVISDHLYTTLAEKYPTLPEALTYLTTLPIKTHVPLSRDLAIIKMNDGIRLQIFGDIGNHSLCKFDNGAVDISNIVFTVQEELSYLLNKMGVPYHV